MIAHLRGRLLSKKASRVIIETGGVGYEVNIPVSTFYELPEPPAEAGLHIFTYVREESLSLYGFSSEREKSVFERLLGVSGVGPRMAIGILSGLEMSDLIPALRSGDVARLVRIPGVGRKTAERLVLELRDKLLDLLPEAAAEGVPPTATASLGTVEDDVLSALINLGYARPSAESALREARAEAPNGNFEQLLRTALRLLARKFFS